MERSSEVSFEAGGGTGWASSKAMASAGPSTVRWVVLKCELRVIDVKARERLSTPVDFRAFEWACECIGVGFSG